MADWSEEVKTGQRENHPLLFVLNNNYPQDDFNANLNYMSAKDRATALALRVIIQDDSGCYGEYTLCAYLVAVTAKKKKRASGVRYAVIWGASLGEDVSDNTPDHTIIDGRSVLHTDEFYGGTNKRTRTVSRWRFGCGVLVFLGGADGSSFAVSYAFVEEEGWGVSSLVH